MRAAVASTSIDTYRAIHKEGQLTRMQLKIMAAIDPWTDYTLQELSKITGLPINTVSGRCNELRTANRLVLGQTRKCHVTGRMVHPVMLPESQPGLF